MAFNLKKVLKALLLSSSQPLAIKDIQAAFTRFHDRATLPLAAATRAESAGQGAREASTGADGATETNEASPVSDGVDRTGEPPAFTPHSSDMGGTPMPRGTGSLPAVGSGEGWVSPVGLECGVRAGAPVPSAEEPAEVFAEAVQDAELYGDVPALVTTAQIRDAMDDIAAELRAADEGLLLIEGNSGYRLVTHPRFARWVRILRQEPPPVKLSQSSIETLAVVAYRQPVTRGEIETIRGVSAEAGINKLLERELIYIVGRADAPGRPIQYGTTDQFLEFVGVKSLDEMPASDVLSSRQIDEWLRNSSTAHAPTDTDMGLSDEQLPLEAAATAPVGHNGGEAQVIAAPDGGETPAQN